MTLYKEPEITAPAGLRASTVMARESQGLRVFLQTPNITRGPVPVQSVGAPMGQFGGGSSMGASSSGGLRKRKRPMYNEAGIPIARGRSGGRGSLGPNPLEGRTQYARSWEEENDPTYTRYVPQEVPGFAEGGEVYTAGGESDEERLRREVAETMANSGEFAAAQKTFLGTPTTPPIYGPPVPTYVENVQAVYQQNPGLVSVAAGEAQANNVDANMAQLRDVIAQQQNQWNPAGGVFGQQFSQSTTQQSVREVASGLLGGARDLAGSVPGVVDSAARAVTPNALEQRHDRRDVIPNTDIPFGVTPFLQDKVQPAAGIVGEAAGNVADPLGLSRGVLPAVGRFLGEGIVPTTGAEFALNAGFSGGPAEALTGIPFDDIIRAGGRGVSSAIARQADNAVPSMGRFAPDVAPQGQRSVMSQVDMPNVAGASPQQEPLASILSRLDNGDSKVTTAYLRSVAADRGIDLAGATKKSDVVAALRAAEVPAGGGVGGLPSPRADAGDIAPSAGISTPPPASNVARVAVQEGAVKPLDPNSLMGSRGAVELSNPAGARVLGRGEQPGPGETLMFHGSGPSGLQGNIRQGLNLTPNEADAASFARINARAESAGLGASNEGITPNQLDASWRPAEPGNLPVNDTDKYVTAQLWARQQPNDDIRDLDLNEIKTRLYNAGLDANGRAAEVRARYQQADAQGVKMPGEEAPTDLPDERDLMLMGRTPQARAAAIANAPPTRIDPEIVRDARLNAASQRIDSLIARAPSPQYSDVASMSNDEVLEQAERLGVAVDEGLITRGLPVGRDQELAKVQNALDAEVEASVGNMERATSDYFSTRTAEEAKTPAAEAVRGARFGQPDVASTERAQGLMGRIWSNLMDAAYTPLGGDVGTALRQDAGQTLNVTNLAQTREVAAYTARAGASREGAQKVHEELAAKLDDLYAKVGKFDLPLADVQGVNATTDLANRETMSSSGLGRVPVIGAPFNVTARMNSTEVNARRVLEMERFVKNHPNEKPAAYQTAANMYERLTGRGTLGSKAMDDATARTIGPLFTSLRFALSIPERVPYLLPWTRLADGSTEIGGAVWREAVREHAGFVSTAGGAMLLAQEAGLDVDWERGKITVGNTDIDLWGGASQYFNMVRNAVEGTKNGLPYPSLLEQGADGVYRGTVAEFVRNKMGPLPGMVLQGAKLTGLDEKLGVTSEMQFLQPDYWDKGVFGLAGSNGEIIDKAASYIVPLWVQDVANAVRVASQTNNNPINAGLLTGALGFFGAGVQNFGGRAERERSQMRNELAINGRERVFGPELAPKIPPNTRYAELGSREKELVNSQMDPHALKETRERAIKEGNQVELAQQQREELKASYRPSFDKLDAALKNGTMTPYEVRQASGALERHMYDAVDKIKFPDRDGGDYKPSAIQQAESGYRALYDKAPKTADGKTDFDALEDLRLSYLAAVSKSQGPEFAGRLAFNVLPRVNPNDSEIQKFYDTPEMKAAVKGYYDAPQGTKTDFLTADPERNALLYAGGTARSLNTPEAVEAYKRYSNGVPEINFTVGWTPRENYVSYANLERGPLGAQVREYRPLAEAARQNEGDFRATNYLRSHPELNALLWQTGHTSKAYTLQAYEQMKGQPTAPTPPPQASASGAVAGRPAPAALAPAGATGARLPPLPPGELNSPTASPKQRENFINAMAAPANAYASTKIPPSVWAAMGASESNWGRAPSVFGIKGVGSAGGANLQTHEILGGKRVDMPDQFAAYNNLDDAFKHFVDLTSHGRYAGAWNHLQQTGDWQGFLQGITQAGYATDKGWANSIIRLAGDIERNYPQINRR